MVELMDCFIVGLLIVYVADIFTGSCFLSDNYRMKHRCACLPAKAGLSLVHL
jgi:hypothetical protein